MSEETAVQDKNYIGDFSSKEDVLSNFNVDASALEGGEILMAWYGYGSYDGEAFVLVRKDGKFFEVNGGHCSCYGLEDQWELEETNITALAMKNFGGYSSEGEAATTRLHEIVAEYSAAA